MKIDLTKGMSIGVLVEGRQVGQIEKRLALLNLKCSYRCPKYEAVKSIVIYIHTAKESNSYGVYDFSNPSCTSLLSYKEALKELNTLIKQKEAL